MGACSPTNDIGRIIWMHSRSIYSAQFAWICRLLEQTCCAALVLFQLVGTRHPIKAICSSNWIISPSFRPKKRRKWETSPNDILDRLNSYTSWHSIDSTCWYFTIYTCKYTPEKFMVCPVIPSLFFSTVPSFSSSWGAWKLGFKVFAFDLAPRRAWYVRMNDSWSTYPTMHMRTGQPLKIHKCTHTHQTKDCCQWDGFLAFFGGWCKFAKLDCKLFII